MFFDNSGNWKVSSHSTVVDAILHGKREATTIEDD